MVTWRRRCIQNQTWCVWHHSILLSVYGLVMCWPLSNSKVRIDPADVIDLLFKVVWLMTYWSCRICWLNAYYWWQLEKLFTKLPIISLVTVMCYHWGLLAMTRILTIYFIQILCVSVDTKVFSQLPALPRWDQAVRWSDHSHKLLLCLTEVTENWLGH